jgi:AcrR family transcriptional regulator
MARPTAEERRRDYLQVGAELVAEFQPTDSEDVHLDALANVRVVDVARRAGVTKGALYHIWESQEDYRLDLLAHLLELEADAGIETTDELLGSLEGEIDQLEVTRRLADIAFDRLKDDPRMLARFSFYNYARDPDVNRLLSSTGAGHEAHYEQYLRASRRRIRAPYTLDQMVVSVNAYFLGLVIRHRTTPDEANGTVDVGNGPWSVYSFGLQALLDHFTEPDDEPRPPDQPRS